MTRLRTGQRKERGKGAQGSSQPPIQWVPRALSAGESDWGVKLTAGLHGVNRYSFTFTVRQVETFLKHLLGMWKRCLVHFNEDET